MSNNMPNADEIPVATALLPESSLPDQATGEQSPAQLQVLDYLTPPERPLNWEGRAWRRFGARLFDAIVFGAPILLMLIVLVKTGILSISILQPLGTGWIADSIDQIIRSMIGLTVEAFFLSTWGTTPGKWLLEMRVVGENDGPPPLANCFKRSALIFAGVYFLAIPWVGVIGELVTYFKFRKAHVAWYDPKCGTIVVYNALSGGRIVFFLFATFVAFGGFMALAILM